MVPLLAVEFATLTLDPVSGLPVAHIFSPAEIDARTSSSLLLVPWVRADLLLAVLEKEGLGKKEDAPAVVA